MTQINRVTGLVGSRGKVFIQAPYPDYESGDPPQNIVLETPVAKDLLEVLKIILKEK